MLLLQQFTYYDPFELGVVPEHLKVRSLLFGPNWVLQQDNDPKHATELVLEWMKAAFKD